MEEVSRRSGGDIEEIRKMHVGAMEKIKRRYEKYQQEELRR